MIGTPIAAGGVGGSGTRVVARILQDLGLFLGADLPGSLDTLWYALLFGRRDVLLDDEARLAELAGLFARQMSDPRPLDTAETALVRQLAAEPRHQHDRAALEAWADSFIAHGRTGGPQPSWGWKVPYTFVLIDRLLGLWPELRYVHIVRDGRDMAFSENQNQLGKWGPVYLNRNVEIAPPDALSYWCAVHRRMERVAARYPGRVHFLSFEALLAEPRPVVAELCRFVGAEPAPDLVGRLAGRVEPRRSRGRYKDHDISGFRAEDLAYLGRWYGPDAARQAMTHD